ncbi:sulfurtransferase [Solimonas sp. K1W22B-7]|uniref:rhodanese-like domain-containing protein n=1 Tax=Solimonas sp. K1W22B-7 TaxID=2303331 RepID=UPI000E333540|nr:rhodanese-like domain-containing protein [Solimonas sp. K1W22B-7]AXQ28782.1 sulfurtransferase [Solimonas sp. K1W22B-7]
MKILTATDLKARLDAAPLTVIDVRSDEELAIAAIPGVRHIPMQELPTRLGELNAAEPVAVLCHHGVRSEMAARFLERNGFAEVYSVGGGIDAWSADVDPTVPRY